MPNDVSQQPTSNHSGLKILGLASFSFTAFVLLIFVLAAKAIVTGQMALLMLVGLVGLYFGGSVLVLVYRFVGRLE